MHENLIQHCYEVAKSAVANGNHPFGALLWKDGEILLTAENTVVTDRDVTRHAELNLVSLASRRLGRDLLTPTVLYTSTEPCFMCAGAIYWAGIPKIVYGVSAASLADLSGSGYRLSTRDLYARVQPGVEVVGPTLEPEGLEIHRNFWRSA